jgi:hypothetical protein
MQRLQMLRVPASLAVVALLLLSAVAFAQSTSPARPRSPSEPSVPHERMTFFEGTWSAEPKGSIKGKPADNSIPAHEETCAWMPGGRRHMICRGWRVRDGVRSDAMYIMSYREEGDIYIVHHAFPSGDTVTYHGTLDGERWVMDMVSAPGLRKTHRLREIITAVPEGVRYVEERSVDGGPWEVTEDYRFRRVK